MANMADSGKNRDGSADTVNLTAGSSRKRYLGVRLPDWVTRRAPVWLVGIMLVVLLVTCIAGAALGVGFTSGLLPLFGTNPKSAVVPTATGTSAASVLILATSTPLSVTSPKPTPTSRPTPSLPPAPTATPSILWYQAPWPVKCNCTRGNLQVTPEVTIWTAGHQYYVFVKTTPGAHIQFRMTAPNGVTSENNWEQSVADPAGDWSILLTAPSGPGFALLQARTDKGAYADTSVACMNN